VINAIPIIGWLVSLFFAVSMAFPFWICWTCCGIGEDFFAFLPAEYHEPGFWQCVGFFTVVFVLKSVLLPRFASTTNVNAK